MAARTFSVVTTRANSLVRQIHSCMPLILGSSDYARWLSDEEDPRELLKPHPSEPMTMWPVSTRVNSPKNDDPGIIERPWRRTPPHRPDGNSA